MDSITDNLPAQLYSALLAQYGNPHRLAQALGVSHQAVYQYRGRIPWRRVPAAHALLAPQAAQDRAGATRKPSRPRRAG